MKNKEDNMLNSVESAVRFIDELDKKVNSINEKGKQGKIYSSHPTMFFRGQEDVSFKLLPSIFRNENLMLHENQIFNKLYSSHVDEFESDKNTFDKLVRMQHYGLPTRLLDITTNPLIALYFACQASFNTEENGNKAIKNVDGALYIYILLNSHIKTYNSDTVSILSNLSILSSSERNAILNKKSNDKTFNRALGKLSNIIRTENPSFSEEYFKAEQLPDFVFVESKMNNKRIKSQSGAFILYKKARQMPEGAIDIPYIDASGANRKYKVLSIKKIIPNSQKKHILSTLDKMNINEKYIYQDISHTANYIKNSI